MVDVYSFLVSKFPNLAQEGFKETSPEAPEYNCIAWAAGDDKRFWWPRKDHWGYWPLGFPREETIETFRAVFSDIGYSLSENDDFEAGYEKVALYATSNILQHAARQLTSGKWSSKLGPFIDIEHTLRGLEGSEYGQVVEIYRRKII